MNREKILDILENATGNSTDILHRLYTDYMENKAEAVKVLQVILEYTKEIGDINDKNIVCMEKQKERELISLYNDIINGITNKIVNMNLSQEEFYDKLYTTFFCSDNEFFPKTKDEKVIALKILSERVWEVPYFQVKETVSVSSEEFREKWDGLSFALIEALHMLRRPSLSKTGLAAQIWRIEHGLSAEKDQIIFLAMFISYLQYSNEEQK